MAARDPFHGIRGPRLPGVLRVAAALLLMPHGAQVIFGSPAVPPPRRPQGACIHKGLGLRHVMPGRRQKLHFSYDLQRLAAAMRAKRGYEVTALPGGNGIRISRRFDGVKYSIIFEGGDPLSFAVLSGKESCATSNRRIRRRVYRMIEDLPFENRQKAELELHVAVFGYAYFSDSFHHPPHSPNPPR